MNMIEKMARAICEADGEISPDEVTVKSQYPAWRNYENQAKAALAALEKPTGDMLLYGHDVVGFGMPNCKRAFCAMIEAAKEGK